MNFIDALGYLYHNRINDEEFFDPFLLYCKLSDLCSSNYEDKRKVSLFYQVDKKINLTKALLNKDDSIVFKYTEVADLLSESSFKKLLETVKRVLSTQYKQEEKRYLPKKAVVQAVVTKAEESQEEETRTPLISTPVGSGDTDVIIGLSIMGGALLAIVLFIVFACIFDWSWSVWQWLVGVAGGVLLSAILGGIVAWFAEECLANYYSAGTFVLGACVLVNFILLLIFRDNYKTIFGCFSGVEVVAGAILAFATFDDREEDWGVAQIIEIVVAIIFFVVAMIWI